MAVGVGVRVGVGVLVGGTGVFVGVLVGVGVGALTVRDTESEQVGEARQLIEDVAFR